MAVVPKWADYKSCIEGIEAKWSSVEIKKVTKTLQVLYAMSGSCQYQATCELLKDVGEIKRNYDRYRDPRILVKLTKLIDALEVLKQSLETIRSRKYDDVVCVGFEIGVPGYGRMAADQYHGYDNDISDINARWKVMEKAIKKASQKYKDLLGNKINVLDDTKVLKIFMAPEFYFRGKRGAYDVGAMPYLCEKAAAVTQNYEHWLFVLGSCVCAATEWKTTGGAITEADITKDKTAGTYTVNKPMDWQQKESAGLVLLDNYAIVQKGGIAWDMNSGAGARVVLKQMRSDIDFDYQTKDDRMTPVHLKKPGVVTPGAHGKYTVGSLLDGHYALVDKATDKTDERGPYGCIFDIDGITFGLEVCLDHYDKRLVNAKNDKSAIRIQLIPSWGAEIVKSNSINKGIVFNVDGQDRLYDDRAARVHCYGGPFGSKQGAQHSVYNTSGPTADGAVFDGKSTVIRYWGPYQIPL
jgi:hypothetical protein